jgi:hypothetical protein
LLLYLSHTLSRTLSQAKKEFEERTLFLKKQSEDLVNKEAMNQVAQEQVVEETRKEEKEAELFLQKQQEKKANKEALNMIAKEQAKKAAKEEEQEQAKTTQALFQSRSKDCPQCGSTMQADAAFCTDCGEKLPPAGELKAVRDAVLSGTHHYHPPSKRRSSKRLAKMASSPRGLSDSDEDDDSDAEADGGQSEGGQSEEREAKTVRHRVATIEKKKKGAEDGDEDDGEGGGKELRTCDFPGPAPTTGHGIQ